MRPAWRLVSVGTAITSARTVIKAVGRRFAVVLMTIKARWIICCSIEDPHHAAQEIALVVAFVGRLFGFRLGCSPSILF
jgi:hypothetical protein